MSTENQIHKIILSISNVSYCGENNLLCEYYQLISRLTSILIHILIDFILAKASWLQ